MQKLDRRLMKKLEAHVQVITESGGVMIQVTNKDLYNFVRMQRHYHDCPGEEIIFLAPGETVWVVNGIWQMTAVYANTVRQ